MSFSSVVVDLPMQAAMGARRQLKQEWCGQTRSGNPVCLNCRRPSPTWQTKSNAHRAATCSPQLNKQNPSCDSVICRMARDKKRYNHAIALRFDGVTQLARASGAQSDRTVLDEQLSWENKPGVGSTQHSRQLYQLRTVAILIRICCKSQGKRNSPADRPVLQNLTI